MMVPKRATVGFRVVTLGLSFRLSTESLQLVAR